MVAASTQEVVILATRATMEVGACSIAQIQELAAAACSQAIPEIVKWVMDSVAQIIKGITIEALEEITEVIKATTHGAMVVGTKAIIHEITMVVLVDLIQGIITIRTVIIVVKRTRDIHMAVDRIKILITKTKEWAATITLTLEDLRCLQEASLVMHLQLVPAVSSVISVLDDKKRLEEMLGNQPDQAEESKIAGKLNIFSVI